MLTDIRPRHAAVTRPNLRRRGRDVERLQQGGVVELSGGEHRRETVNVKDAKPLLH